MTERNSISHIGKNVSTLSSYISIFLKRKLCSLHVFDSVNNHKKNCIHIWCYKCDTSLIIQYVFFIYRFLGVSKNIKQETIWIWHLKMIKLQCIIRLSSYPGIFQPKLSPSNSWCKNCFLRQQHKLSFRR